MFDEQPMMSFCRRQLLRRTCAGFGSLALTSMLSDQAYSAEPGPLDAGMNQRTHFPAKAKRVIFLFMKGGPSHMDTFDHKPQLQKDDAKPLPFDKPRVAICANG